MKRLLFSSAALILASLATPAGAVDARGAIKSCDANPKCDYIVSDNGDVVITIGIKTIICPQRGECIVQSPIKLPKGTGGKASGVTTSVESVLQNQQ